MYYNCSLVRCFYLHSTLSSYKVAMYAMMLSSDVDPPLEKAKKQAEMSFLSPIPFINCRI